MEIATLARERERPVSVSRFRKKAPPSPEQRLFEMLETGDIQLPDQNTWPDELVGIVRDYLSEQNREPSFDFSELSKAIDTHANRPQSRPNDTESIASTQLSPFASAYIYSKLPPSLRLFASQYATADERVRKRTKQLVFNKEWLTHQHPYTPAEVDQMLRMFIRLDRLVYLDRVIAKEREQLNAKYNGDLSDAPKLRRNMKRVAEEMAEEYKLYYRVRNRYREIMQRNRADSIHERPVDSVDYLKIGKVLSKKFEDAVAELYRKDQLHQPTSVKKMRQLMTYRGIRASFQDRFGIKLGENFVVRLKDLAQTTYRQVLGRIDLPDHYLNVRRPRTNEVDLLDLPPSYQFGERVRKELQRSL